MRLLIFGVAIVAACAVIGGRKNLWATETNRSTTGEPTKPLEPQTKNPGGWPYADVYDEVTAAGELNRVRYEDDHIRLVEVGYFPGVHSPMHGQPWASVVAYDSSEPSALEDTNLDPKSELNGQGAGHGPAPQGLQNPTCETMKPRAPHAVTNNDSFPLHYFRLEFKRIDGDGLQANWKAWYPWMLLPIKTIANIDPRDPNLGPPVSKEYPFAYATESYKAAPNNHRLLYEDDHILFLEVAVRPGERENLHGHSFPSVFAFDVGPVRVSGPTPIPATVPPLPEDRQPGMGHGVGGGDYRLDPYGRNGQGGGTGGPPEGMKWPSCTTMGPQWPHAVGVANDYPLHFYRIEYKRIDGDGIKTHWREWYPWMATLADDRNEHAQQANR